MRLYSKHQQELSVLGETSSLKFAIFVIACISGHISTFLVAFHSRLIGTV